MTKHSRRSFLAALLAAPAALLGLAHKARPAAPARRKPARRGTVKSYSYPAGDRDELGTVTVYHYDSRGNPIDGSEGLTTFTYSTDQWTPRWHGPLL